MSTFFEIVYNIVAPIFIIVGVCVLVDRRFKPDPSGLSRLVVYLFTPFMILEGIANSDLKAAEAGQLVAVALGISAGVALAAWGVAQLAGFDRRLESAFILCAVLVNAGNYGIPLNKFAFGAAGEERALIFFVTTVVVSNTLGVFLASRGTVSTRRALLNVLTVPLPYAALIGFGLNVGQVELPVPLARAVSLLGQAAIPAMLAVLGIQLSRASFRGQVGGPVLLASGMRLVISPLIALGLAALLNMSGVTRQVAIVQSAMPSAVIGGVLAIEFGGDAEFVTAEILVSTLLSIVSLSVLLTLLM